MNPKPSSHWAQLAVPQKIAYASGAVVILTGLLHAIAFLLAPNAELAGPLGFRKPIVFGVSAGLTIMTLGWLLRFFPPKPRLHAIMMGAMSAALVAEIVIIDVQRLRGLPSHFNIGTPLDTALWSIMGIAIYLFASVSILLAVQSRGALRAEPAMALAIRASLALLAFSQISGQIIVVHGMIHVIQDGAFVLENVATATTLGAAGDLKLPHAISLHAIQALPILGLLLGASALRARFQNTLVLCSAGGFTAVTLFAQFQSLNGQAFLDADLPWTLALAASALAFAAPYGIAIAALPRARCPLQTAANRS